MSHILMPPKHQRLLLTHFLQVQTHLMSLTHSNRSLQIEVYTLDASLSIWCLHLVKQNVKKKKMFISLIFIYLKKCFNGKRTVNKDNTRSFQIFSSSSILLFLLPLLYLAIFFKVFTIFAIGFSHKKNFSLRVYWKKLQAKHD